MWSAHCHNHYFQSHCMVKLMGEDFIEGKPEFFGKIFIYLPNFFKVISDLNAWISHSVNSLWSTPECQGIIISGQSDCKMQHYKILWVRTKQFYYISLLHADTFWKREIRMLCEYNPRRHLGSLYVIYADSHPRIMLTTLIAELDFSQLHF